MATISQSNPGMIGVKASTQGGSMPFVLQVTTMTWRSVKNTLRVPAAIIPGILISIFFLFIYTGTLGDAAQFLPGLAGQSYLGFILPLSVLSAALSGSTLAGEGIVRDIENGYFDKLMLTPASRAALLLGHMISGALLLVVQTLVVIGVALLMGLNPATGVVGVIALIGIALLLGTAFAGLPVGVALATGSSAATSGASFLFFPLSFLTASFVPLNLLSGWIETAALYNPVTYVIEAGRALLNTGWDNEVMLRGFSSIAVMGAIFFGFALYALRIRLKRK
ncbi:MAG: ABC transporter permease [bacterium]|nr:ABC transporter permease [bacterium]